MRVDDERRTTHSIRAGRVVLAATAAASALLFASNHKINLGNSSDSGQQDNPVATGQMNREIGQLELGDQVLSITKYEESSVEDDPSKTEVFIYGESKKDPREVMNDGSWLLAVGSKDGQFPTVMVVYPPAVENGVSADNSGFSYHVVIKAMIPSGTQNYSLELMHDMGEGAAQSQSIPFGQVDRTPQKRT